jgi:hypothetical protein
MNSNSWHETRLRRTGLCETVREAKAADGPFVFVSQCPKSASIRDASSQSRSCADSLPMVSHRSCRCEVLTGRVQADAAPDHVVRGRCYLTICRAVGQHKSLRCRCRSTKKTIHSCALSVASRTDPPDPDSVRHTSLNLRIDQTFVAKQAAVQMQDSAWTVT